MIFRLTPLIASDLGTWLPKSVGFSPRCQATGAPALPLAVSAEAHQCRVGVACRRAWDGLRGKSAPRSPRSGPRLPQRRSLGSGGCPGAGGSGVRVSAQRSMQGGSGCDFRQFLFAVEVIVLFCPIPRPGRGSREAPHLPNFRVCAA